MNYFIRLFVLCGCVLAAGCASVSGGNTQKMYVQTQAQDGKPVDGADCSLSNDKGTWRIKSPGDTSITRSNKRMEIKCDKSSLPQGVVTVESATRGAMFGNIILGGVVGAVIDHSSGAGYEYPEVIKVVMGRFTAMDQPKAATPAATAEAQKVARTRQEQAQAAPAPTQPSVPSSATAPVAVNSPAPAPIASGYARIDDVDAVPYLSDKGREDYRQWVGQPTPKAFAVATDGAWFGAWSLKPRDPSHPSDPSERAMTVCQQRTKTTCMMYAVNGSVVWTKPLTNATASAPVVRVHARAVPPASDFAVTSNVDAVPVRPEGKARYQHYLTLPAPKAFAVYETGGWRFASDSPDAMTSLLDTCAREGRKCWLYSVDDKVVWREDLKQRVGRSDQLGSN